MGFINGDAFILWLTRLYRSLSLMEIHANLLTVKYHYLLSIPSAIRVICLKQNRNKNEINILNAVVVLTIAVRFGGFDWLDANSFGDYWTVLEMNWIWLLLILSIYSSARIIGLGFAFCFVCFVFLWRHSVQNSSSHCVFLLFWIYRLKLDGISSQSAKFANLESKLLISGTFPPLIF